MKTDYYTYAYLREDRTPYYIGKGRLKRAWSKQHSVRLPPKERILILKQDMTNEEACRHEVYMVSVFGRQDLGTGILRNMTAGGEGAVERSAELNKKVSDKMKGVKKTKEHVRKASMAKKGYKHTEAAKEKMRQAKLGKAPHNKGKKRTTPVSAETREKLRLAALKQWEDGRGHSK